MGDKVSKIKKGIQKGLVINVEFSNAEQGVPKITSQEILDLLSCMIQTGNLSVRTFSITGDSLTDDVGTKLGILLRGWNSQNSSRKPASLEVLLQQADFSQVGVNAIFGSLEECDLIRKLVIVGTYKPIDESVIETLKDALERNKHLEHLSLGGFAVTAQFTKQFMTLMGTQRTIKSLRLVKWALRPEDITALLNSPYHNIESLDLSGCDIGNEGCRAIANCIGRGVLKKLYLNENNISDKGVEYILDVLSNEPITCNLQFISFENNPDIENEDMLKIVEGELAKRRANDLKARKASNASDAGSASAAQATATATTASDASTTSTEQVKEKLVQQVMLKESN